MATQDPVDPATRNDPVRRGSVLAALSALALAATNVLAPLVYSAGSNPPTVLMLRALATVVVIGAILILSGRLKMLSRRYEIHCVISGLLFMFAGFGLLNALAIAPAGMVVLVLYLFPILTTLFDAIVNRRRPSFINILLLMLALLGLYLALGGEGNGLSRQGFLLALLAAISAAATLVWNNHMLGPVDPEQITFRMFLVSLVVFGTYVLFTANFALPSTSSGMAQLIFMSACFAVAFTMMFRAVQMAGSVNAAMIMNLEPVITIILAFLILSQTLNSRQALGALLVIGAVMASQLGHKIPSKFK